MTDYKDIYQRFIDMLDGIANGTVKVYYSKRDKTSPTYFDENFITNTGWRFSYFDDNGDWDYWSSISTPDHQQVFYNDINEWNNSLTTEQQDYRVALMNFNPDEKTYTILHKLSLEAFNNAVKN